MQHVNIEMQPEESQASEAEEALALEEIESDEGEYLALAKRT